jgi:hypothetical protein
MYAAASIRELFRKASLLVARNQHFTARRWSDVGQSSFGSSPDCTADVGVIGGGVALKSSKIEHKSHILLFHYFLHDLFSQDLATLYS